MAVRVASIHGLNLNFHADTIVSITVYPDEQLEFTFADGSQHLFTTRQKIQKVTILNSANFQALVGRLPPQKTTWLHKQHTGA